MLRGLQLVRQARKQTGAEVTQSAARAVSLSSSASRFVPAGVAGVPAGVAYDTCNQIAHLSLLGHGVQQTLQLWRQLPAYMQDRHVAPTPIALPFAHEGHFWKCCASARLP